MLNACVKAGVKRVVVVSSITAIMLNPNWPKDKDMDEECWSDQGFCRQTEVRPHMLSVVKPVIGFFFVFIDFSLICIPELLFPGQNNSRI